MLHGTPACSGRESAYLWTKGLQEYLKEKPKREGSIPLRGRARKDKRDPRIDRTEEPESRACEDGEGFQKEKGEDKRGSHLGTALGG